MSSPRSRPGWFIVFEGGDGVGKSTQVELLADALADAGVDHLVTREPGGSSLGQSIRALLLDPGTGAVAPRAEALMYAADKAQHVNQVVIPALEAGSVVICDRYLDSMIAYQGAGRVLDVDEVRRLGEWATGGLRPDLTVLLDIDPRRAVAAKEKKDRLEQAGVDFHERARQGFLDLAAEDPQSYLVLPALGSMTDTAAAIRAHLAGLGVPGLGAATSGGDAAAGAAGTSGGQPDLSQRPGRIG